MADPAAEGAGASADTAVIVAAAQLKVELEERDLSTKGLKAVLKKRLLEAL